MAYIFKTKLGDLMFKKPINPLFITDFYKTGHVDQYPEGTEIIYSNFTPRFAKYQNVPVNGVVVAGITNFVTNFIDYYWQENFFKRPKNEVVEEYREEISTALNTTVRVEHVEHLHDLGKLPITFEALPEGSFVPYGVPVIRITNTDSKCFWVTNYLETVISNELWKPMTTATTAAWYRQLLDKFCEKTNPEAIDFVDFQAHDFSMRGMSGWQDATVNGVSHLMFFKGTDTISSIPLIRQLYGDKGFIGGSVPASEHSVACAGGKENEADTLERFLTKIYPTGIFSFVSDTWDYWGMLTKILPTLKDKIMARDGKLVIRPDSGDPVKIICGEVIEDCSSIPEEKFFDHVTNALYREVSDKDKPPGVHSKYFKHLDKAYKVTIEVFIEDDVSSIYDSYVMKSSTIEPVDLTAEEKGSIEVLWDLFGGTISSTGYKVLDSHIGLIYGDAITPARMQEILRQLEAKGFASTNVVFGVGSYTYNMVSRDTHGFAMKATWAQINGVGQDLFKQPKTDPSKNSAKGRFKVGLVAGKGYVMFPKDSPVEDSMVEYYNVLPPSYEAVRAFAKFNLSYGIWGDA